MPACCLGAGDAKLGSFDQLVPHGIGDRVDDIYRLYPGGTGDVHTAHGKAMDAGTDLFEFGDECADVDGTTAREVEIGDD